MFTSFSNSESGAVTVDWVVLTAGLVGLGLATMAVVNDGAEDLSTDIKGELERNDIIVTAFATPYEPFHPTAFADVYGKYTDPAHASYTVPTQAVLQAAFEADMNMAFTELENDWPITPRSDYLHAYEQVAAENDITINYAYDGNPDAWTAADVLAAQQARGW